MANTKTLNASQVLALLQGNPELLAAIKSAVGTPAKGIRVERAVLKDGTKLKGVSIFGAGKSRYLDKSEFEYVVANADAIRKLFD